MIPSYNTFMIRRYQQLLPIASAVLLVVAICGLITYWVLTIKASRTIPAPVGVIAQTAAPLNLEPAKALFGVAANSGAALAVQIQLAGVVSPDIPGPDAAAIVSVDGKPAEFVRVGREIAPGVILKEVHGKSIVVTRAGATEEIQLPQDAIVGIGAPTHNLPAINNNPVSLPPASGQPGFPDGAANNGIPPGAPMPPDGDGPQMPISP